MADQHRGAAPLLQVLQHFDQCFLAGIVEVGVGFIEHNQLKPGESIEVETRDPAADAVRLRSKNRPPITIGARAASKLLVEVDRQ